MGSATAEECTQRNINSFAQMQRPMFYSCSDCGRKFTKRALEIHKQQCSENENCSCAVCKISKTKLSLREDCVLRDVEQSSPKKLKSKNNLEHLQLTTEIESTSVSNENVQPVRAQSDVELTGPVSSLESNEKLGHVLTYSLQNTPQFQNVKLSGTISSVIPYESNEKLNQLLADSLQPIPSPRTQTESDVESTGAIPIPTENNNVEMVPNGIINIATPIDGNVKKLIRITSNRDSRTTNVEIVNNGAICAYDKRPESLGVLEQNIAYIVEKNRPIKPKEPTIPIKPKEPTIPIKPKEPTIPINSKEKNIPINSKETTIPINEENSSSVDDPLQIDENSSTSNDADLCLPSENIERFHDKQQCTRKIFCVICGDHILWNEFTMHVLAHSIKVQPNNFRCPLCSDNRSSATYFLMHFYSHISAHPTDCEECKCHYPSCLESAAAPLTEHCYAESLDHRCYICLRYFSHFQTLVNHMRRHSEELPFYCKECPRSFRQIGNLQRHMATHRGDRPFKCQKCCRSFADPATLRNHHRVHTKETPYICGTCHRGFSQVGNLKRHMALHVQKGVRDSYIKVLDDDKKAAVVQQQGTTSQETNLPTSQLPNDTNTQRETTTISEVTVLKRKVTRRKRDDKALNLHICDKCGKKYTWKHDLDIHFRTHTGEKPYKCELCPKRFAQSGAVRIHKIRHHATLEQIRERLRKKEIKALPHSGFWTRK